jgi:hypothetical protein
VIPRGEELSATVDANMKLPPTFEIKTIQIDKGDARFSAPEGLQFSMSDADSVKLEAPQGIEAHIIDQKGKNFLDLSTGLIRLTDENGVVHQWHLTGELKDLMQDTVLKLDLSGDGGYEVKAKP